MCDKLNCTNGGIYKPVLLFYAPKEYNFPEPIKCILGLKICLEHKKSGTVDDFLSNEGWIQLCERIAGIGKVIPDRKLTKLTWELA